MNDVNDNSARWQIKKITTGNNSGGCRMGGGTNNGTTTVELSLLADDYNSLITRSAAVVTPSSRDTTDDDDGYTTNDDDGDSTAHSPPPLPMPSCCSANRMTNQKKTNNGLTQQQQQPQPLSLFRTPWNQKIRMTPLTMALTTASSSSFVIPLSSSTTTATTTRSAAATFTPMVRQSPSLFLSYHDHDHSAVVDNICNDSNKINNFNVVSNGVVELVDDDDHDDDCDDEAISPCYSTTITNQNTSNSLTQQQPQPLSLFRTPWNQKIRMTPLTMALTTASSSSSSTTTVAAATITPTATSPSSFLSHHDDDIAVDSICNNNNSNVSNDVVDYDCGGDDNEEAILPSSSSSSDYSCHMGMESSSSSSSIHTTTTACSPMTPRTNDYMKYNSPFKSYMTILDERLDSVTKELHRLDCRIEQCYSNDDDDEDDDDEGNNDKAIYDDLYGKEDQMSKYYCYSVDDNVVDDMNDCHRAVVEETMINVTNDEHHEYHGNEIMSDEDENDKENIVPSSTLNNHPPSDDATGSSDSKSVDGDSTGKKRHRMGEVNIVNSFHSTSDRSHRLPPQQMSCQPHQQEHINCVIGDTPFDSCSTKVRRVLWKEGAFTPCYNSNDDEVPIQLFPIIVTPNSETIQHVTNECDQVTKERDQLLNLVVELQQLRREDAVTSMQLQREHQPSLAEIDQLRSELNKQETAYREDNERLNLAMKVTPTEKLTSAEASYYGTTDMLRDNIKVLELRNSELVSKVEQLTSSLNVVVEENKVLQIRIEDNSAAYNELLKDNIVIEEKQCRLLNVVNDLTVSLNAERLDYEKKIDSLTTLLEAEKTANATIVKKLERTFNDVMFQKESLEGSLSTILSEKTDLVNSLQDKSSLLLDSQAENESLSMQLLDLRKTDEVKGQEIKVMQQQFEVVRAQRDELFGKSAVLKKSLARSIQLLEKSKDRESQIVSLNESIVNLRTMLSGKDTQLARMSIRVQELQQQQMDSTDSDSKDVIERANHFQHLAARLAVSLLQLRIKWKQSNEHNLVAQLTAQNDKVATLERCVDGVTADRHALAITHFHLHEKVSATAAEIAAEEKAQLNSQIRSLSEKIVNLEDELQLLRAKGLNQTGILSELTYQDDQLLQENTCIIEDNTSCISSLREDNAALTMEHITIKHHSERATCGLEERQAVNCSDVDNKESSVAYYSDSPEMATPPSAEVKTLLHHVLKLESQLESSVIEVDVLQGTIKSNEATISDLRNQMITLDGQNSSKERQLSSLLSRMDIYVSERDGLALQLDKSVMELNCVREERNEMEKMSIEVRNLRVGLAKSQEELATTKRDCHVIHRQSMALRDIVGKAKILLEKSEIEKNRLQYELDNVLHDAMKEMPHEDSSRTPHVAFIEEFNNNIQPVAKRGNNNELTMLAVRQSTDTGAIIDLDERQQASSNNNCVNNNDDVPAKVSSLFMKNGLSMFDLLKDTHKSGRKDNMKYRN